eukprot:TRINITY_DN10428_c0_g1_i1.p1 TRINITY_DN10428_c0_g1~~TRINITY_DN10428_c0_g1_i1.p1  ORF type:complete len:237 (+),score=22.38 TRINITY_DN10428_c0_g1_i1:72-713(+)
MKLFIQQVSKPNEVVVMQPDEYPLFLTCCSRQIAITRFQIRVVHSLLSQEHGSDSIKITYLKELIKCMKKELKEYIDDRITLVKRYFLPDENDTNNQPQRFNLFLMIADYHRYLSEYEDQFRDSTEEYYLQLLSELGNTMNATRLRLILNYSVFLREIKMDQKQAIKVSETEYKKGLKYVKNNCNYDCFFLLQLLKDNTDLWKSNTGTRGSLI